MSNGGTDDETNLVAACKECNEKKGGVPGKPGKPRKLIKKPTVYFGESNLYSEPLARLREKGVDV